MKKIILDFLRRGFTACFLGPLVLAALYLILQKYSGIQTLTVNEVCRGIISLSALAFIAGGMNIIYQIERLPLMTAILIHGAVLYAGYLLTYLINGWLAKGLPTILVFTGIFIVGYLAIWTIIYSITKSKTEKLNKKLNEKNGMN